jgi:hypothetical protein
MYDYKDPCDLELEKHEEMLEQDTRELFRIARDFIGVNPRHDTFSITDDDGSTITVRLEETNAQSQRMTYEDVADQR